MNRPYIICHMLASLDGRITGPYMDTQEADWGDQAFETINTEFRCDAWMNGRTTVEENMTLGRKPEIQEGGRIYSYDDYVAKKDAEMYMVAVDPSGKLGWTQNYVQYASRPKAHIIEVLTKKVPAAYLSYLRELHISYIIAGESELDCSVTVQKLKSLFGIQRLKLGGGGILNWSFLQAGLVDEFSVVIAPVADGSTGMPALFDRGRVPTEKETVSFQLKEVKSLENGCVWLHYTVKNC